MNNKIGPAYQRVADDLMSKIRSGELKVGEPIPSTPKLQQQYGVSSTVVRRAVTDLTAAGILIGHGGKAIYVQAKPKDVEDERITVEDLREQVSALQEEVRRLAERTGSSGSLEDMASEIAEVRSIVGLLQVHLRTLYDRVGQPYPETNTETKPDRQRNRKSS